MQSVVAEQVNLKFLIDGELKNRLDAALEAQGVSLTTGMTRLIRFFLDDAADLQPVVLKQVKGNAAKAIAEMFLRALPADHAKEDPPLDNIGVILHPERPEQIIKPPKRKRTG